MECFGVVAEELNSDSITEKCADDSETSCCGLEVTSKLTLSGTF